MARISKRVRKAQPQTRRKTLAPQKTVAPAKAGEANLKQQLAEALERQTATAEILKVIASSPSDLQPVFDAIAASALRLLGGRSSAVTRVVGDTLQLAAFTATTEAGNKALKNLFPTPLASAPGIWGMVIKSRRPETRSDVQGDPRATPEVREMARSRGFRSALAVPMLRDGVVIGAINITRAETGPFTDHQINLLQTFADQAVIAIQNVQSFNETKEALERQTATAEILKVIASSPSDVQPVFDAIAASAKRLLDGGAALVARRSGDMLHLAGFTSTGEAGDAALRTFYPVRIVGEGHLGKAILSGQPILISDIETESGYTESFRALARTRGLRSVVSVPMLCEGEAIGVISVNRPVAGKFSDHQTNLLRTFASQAVIAIENVRLFNETKEALEQQTATAEILRVISSSQTDVQPVFNTIVRSVVRLCDGLFSGLYRFDGELIHHVAQHNFTPEALEEVQRIFPARATRALGTGRAIIERAVVHIADVEVDPEHQHKGLTRAVGMRSGLFVPMLREGDPIGVIMVARAEPGPFSDNQIDLLKTFADQAVIAIENVRLFKELQQRTDALTRSVGQLTALGEVGQAISSTLDLETVLKTIVSRAVQLAGLDAGVIYEYDVRTEQFQLRASENFDDESVAGLRGASIRRGEGAVGASVVTREPTQVPDTHAPGYPARLRDLLDRSGYRALLAVPLAREDDIIGALMVIRKLPGPFAPEVVELLKTFASQSALAIQNARLFREIAEKGKQLEEASQHKSQFLASMSHELRTPLNAILGFNEMILDEIYGPVAPDVRSPLEEMQASGKHLLRLINNVLDLAKIEAGRMELSLQDYSVHDTVESVRSTLRSIAAEKGLELLTAVPGDIPLAYGDPGRMSQCLLNLAGNALKFTKAGKVEIGAKLEGDQLVYRVSDTGIGIPADKIGSLFTEFKQTDATIASEYGGTGLGLSITKKFIEMHGGRIWIESELGKGSAFIFEVPLRAKTT